MYGINLVQITLLRKVLICHSPQAGIQDAVKRSLDSGLRRSDERPISLQAVQIGQQVAGNLTVEDAKP
jgi:hypothetical protein